jgi:tRNA threonylcarbamoyl adenosine modification protein YeaZ
MRLALNCCETRLQAALCGEEGLLHFREWTVPGKASRFLAPTVSGALEALGATPRDLEGVAVVRGPGSFTGLRMSMAFASGLARSLDLPMAGLDYLPLLASGPGQLLRGTIAVAVHSRMREVYLQFFAAPSLETLTPPEAIRLRHLPSRISTVPSPVHLMGSGLERNPDFFRKELSTAHRLDPSFNHPSPEILARGCLAAHYAKEPAQPLYIRPSDAEENLTDIAAGRGLDPENARALLDRATGGNAD